MYPPARFRARHPKPRQHRDSRNAGGLKLRSAPGAAALPTRWRASRAGRSAFPAPDQRDLSATLDVRRARPVDGVSAGRRWPRTSPACELKGSCICPSSSRRLRRSLRRANVTLASARTGQASRGAQRFGSMLPCGCSRTAGATSGCHGSIWRARSDVQHARHGGFCAN